MSGAPSSGPLGAPVSSISAGKGTKKDESTPVCPLKDPASVLAIETWVTETKRLLEVERQAEIDERTSFLEDTNMIDLEASGLCLLSLKVIEESTGLYGRSLVTVGDWSSRLLPSHRIGVGDIVGLRPASGKLSGGKHDVTGIVSRVTEYHITVTIDDKKTGPASVEDAVDALPDKVRMDLLANDVTYQRLSNVLRGLESGKFGRADRLVRILFGLEVPRARPVAPVTPFRPGLNESQLSAIAVALASQDVCLIHGPPGTGKTTTVVELIRQAVARGERVLAVAPSNVAVDNIVERLAVKLPDSSVNVVRVGHPARLSPAILPHCLDAKILTAEGTDIVRDVRTELEATQKQRSKCRDKSQRRELQAEERRLRKEIKIREERVVQDILKSANVVCTTNAGSAAKVIQKVFGIRDSAASTMDGGTGTFVFDLVVIDEVAQALEASCWIPLLLGSRCVLAGDHCQLPPTITSKQAEAEGFNVTLADRIAARFGERTDVVSMLTVQYRMNDCIMGWSSHELYNDKLTSHESVASHTLSDLKTWRPVLSGGGPGLLDDEEGMTASMLLIDTAGCGIEEVQEISTESKANPGEANIVRIHVMALLRSGLKPDDIAVITPYNAQVSLLRSLLLEDCPRVEVRSVDGFQGQEREAVVLSFVRSNASKEVGFLADHRRINVAVTRAKRHVAIVADSDTVSSDPFLKRLIEYMHAHGVIRSAMEFDEVNGRASFISAASSSRIDEISSRFIASSAVAGPRARGGGIEAGKASSDARNDKRRKEFIAFFRSQFASVERTVQSIENNSAKIERIRFPYPALSDKEAGLDKAASVAVVSREGNVLRLTFPPSLSSFERMLVHELAETSGMVHESVGEGDTRRIVVSRSFILPVAVEPPVKPISAVFSSLRPSCLEAVADEGHLLESASEALLCETHSVSPPPVPVERTIQSVLEPEAVLAPAVQTDVNAIHSAPPEPPSMAVLAAERAARQKAKGVVGGPRVTAKPGNAVSLGDRGLSGSGKAKNATSGGAAGGPSLYLGVPSVGVKQVPDVLSAKGKSSSVTPSAEVDDDMALLDAVIAQSRVCAGKGCTKSILTISCLCKFCNLKFCYAHGQAEAHGCGDRAREAARTSVKASASTGDSKPLQGWQRTSLESQLKKKLDESAAKRASAPKKSTSKKK